MFQTLLENNYDKELQEDSKKHIIEEREQYNDIFLFILNYSKNNNMLISNINLLLEKNYYWNLIEMYGLKIDESAKNLLVMLCDKFDKLFLLKMVKEKQEYYIEYNLRRLCVLNSIKPYKTLTIYDFISPVHYKINNDVTIYLMPFLVEIIYFYKSLYDPSMSSSWEEIYQDIKKIEIHVDNELESIINMPKNELALKLSTSNNFIYIKPKKKMI